MWPFVRNVECETGISINLIGRSMKKEKPVIHTDRQYPYIETKLATVYLVVEHSQRKKKK